jgi:hypothetical protein
MKLSEHDGRVVIPFCRTVLVCWMIQRIYCYGHILAGYARVSVLLGRVIVFDKVTTETTVEIGPRFRHAHRQVHSGKTPAYLSMYPSPSQQNSCIHLDSISTTNHYQDIQNQNQDRIYTLPNLLSTTTIVTSSVVSSILESVLVRVLAL